MPTYDRGFQLGLLPEKKWNWRTFAASYGILAGLIVLLIVIGIMTSDALIPIVSYHVTELVPLPALRPEPLPKAKPLPVHAKLLPPEPAFQAPKLIVPKELRAPTPPTGAAPQAKPRPVACQVAAAGTGVSGTETDRAQRAPRAQTAAAGN